MIPYIIICQRPTCKSLNNFLPCQQFVTRRTIMIPLVGYNVLGYETIVYVLIIIIIITLYFIDKNNFLPYSHLLVIFFHLTVFTYEWLIK